jgi:hypothetical protein
MRLHALIDYIHNYDIWVFFPGNMQDGGTILLCAYLLDLSLILYLLKIYIKAYLFSFVHPIFGDIICWA